MKTRINKIHHTWEGHGPIPKLDWSFVKYAKHFRKRDRNPYWILLSSQVKPLLTKTGIPYKVWLRTNVIYALNQRLFDCIKQSSKLFFCLQKYKVRLLTITTNRYQYFSDNLSTTQWYDPKNLLHIFSKSNNFKGMRKN